MCIQMYHDTRSDIYYLWKSLFPNTQITHAYVPRDAKNELDWLYYSKYNAYPNNDRYINTEDRYYMFQPPELGGGLFLTGDGTKIPLDKLEYLITGIAEKCEQIKREIYTGSAEDVYAEMKKLIYNKEYCDSVVSDFVTKFKATCVYEVDFKKERMKKIKRAHEKK